MFTLIQSQRTRQSRRSMLSNRQHVIHFPPLRGVKSLTYPVAPFTIVRFLVYYPVVMEWFISDTHMSNEFGLTHAEKAFVPGLLYFCRFPSVTKPPGCGWSAPDVFEKPLLCLGRSFF